MRPLSLLPAVLLAVGAATAAAPAAAHPFGDPQTLEVSADGATVRVRWQAADDDLTALAMRLDLLPGPRRTVFRDGALVPERTDEADVELLAQAPELADYLTTHLRIGPEGECRGELVDASDLAGRGALLEYACPAPVGDVVVSSDLLLDLHPAYQAMARGPGGQSHVFSQESTRHTFAASGTGEAARAGWQLAGYGTAGIALLAGAGWWLRRRSTGGSR